MTAPGTGANDPTAALDAALRAGIAGLPPMPPDLGSDPLPDAEVERLWALFDAQAASRHLDVVARELKATGTGYYTIGSAGHESNAAVALATRPTDPALLHYRSGAFYLARAAGSDTGSGVRDVLGGLTGSADEPIAGGRHKVFGHAEHAVIPQTSTIASHLPRALGLALAIHRGHRLGVEGPYPRDAVVVCSFGDASANHSTATGAINATVNAAYRGLPVPLLLVCEDNGWGISVPTPTDWITTAYGSRPGLTYLSADGADPLACLAAADEAVSIARSRRTPVFLHLRTVRFLGHAGSDAEVSYRRPSELRDDLPRDPILGTATALVTRAGVRPSTLLTRYDARRSDVDRELASLGRPRQLASAGEIVEPLAPRSPNTVAAVAASYRPEPADRARTLAESINQTLSDILAAEPRTLVFGEDVGVKGGVYGVTGGLARRHGSARVFDTILDEQSILGLGLGAGLAGLLPIPEIQYLAYLHNAEDQLRGEAASLSFFSQGQFRNPMVVRVAGLAYQRGFGGHFHNDNAVGVLRDIPGLVVACPARPDDAAAMLRTCVASAAVDGSVSVYLEPIALYHQRDVLAAGDGGWLAADDGEHVPIGRARTYGDGSDLTIATFGNGVPMSLRAARTLADAGIAARVLDLRWIAPLPVDDLLSAARATDRVLVADETRQSGGVGEGVVTALVEHGHRGPIGRVASQDSFVPLGSAASHVLLSEEQITEAALHLVRADR